MQFHFQLVRTNDMHLDKLSILLKELLLLLKHNLRSPYPPERQLSKEYLTILYTMIGHTRDILDGKGECALTYMMIYTWFSVYPSLALFAIKCMVTIDSIQHPYGSWKDLKYFCQFCKDRQKHIFHPLIHYPMMLINEQLKLDIVNNDNNNNKALSLAAKWVPREKSSFGWMYPALAMSFFNSTDDTETKCKMKYRKLLSAMNRKLDTLQIKQCANNWSDIDFNHVTSVSTARQKYAFLNKLSNGNVRHADRPDRITCASQFAAHIDHTLASGKELNGKRVSTNAFVQQAIQLICDKRKKDVHVEIDLLNSQWRDHSASMVSHTFGHNMIAMVDVSNSMTGDPMNAAIAIALCISEKSVIANRVLTFGAKPNWIQLENENPTFVSKVEQLLFADWGGPVNFGLAIDLILDAILESNVSQKDVRNLVLVVLSDMQMEAADSARATATAASTHESIKRKYADAGMRLYGTPLNPPHILFWNLGGNSSGENSGNDDVVMPCMPTDANATMISGFSPQAILKTFPATAATAATATVTPPPTDDKTPWSQLLKSLQNGRYDILRETILKELG